MTLEEYKLKFNPDPNVQDYVLQIYIDCVDLDFIGKPIDLKKFKRKYVNYHKKQNPDLFKNQTGTKSIERF